MFYTDRRTVFEYKQKNSPSLENDTFTQFGYACKQLGVDLKTTSIPQAKGRIERLFGTLQSRLPAELRLAGISTIEQANEFLASYLKEFNARFALDMDCIKSVFEKQPDEEKIDQFLAVIHPKESRRSTASDFRTSIMSSGTSRGCARISTKGLPLW